MSSVSKNNIDRLSTVRAKRLSSMSFNRTLAPAHQGSLRGMTPNNASKNRSISSRTLIKSQLGSRQHSPLSPRSRKSSTDIMLTGSYKLGLQNRMETAKFMNNQRQSLFRMPQAKKGGLQKFTTLKIIQKINMNLQYLSSNSSAFGRNSTKKGQQQLLQLQRRQNKLILPDNKWEKIVNQYLNQFPEGSLKHLLAQFSPVPATEILD